MSAKNEQLAQEWFDDQPDHSERVLVERLTALLDEVEREARAASDERVAILSERVRVDDWKAFNQGYERGAREMRERAANVSESAASERDEYLLARCDAVPDDDERARQKKEAHTRPVAERSLLRQRLAAAIRALPLTGESAEPREINSTAHIERELKREWLAQPGPRTGLTDAELASYAADCVRAPQPEPLAGDKWMVPVSVEDVVCDKFVHFRVDGIRIASVCDWLRENGRLLSRAGERSDAGGA